MTKQKNGEIGREKRIHVVTSLYARETCERQVFVEDLKAYRKRKQKTLFNGMVTEVGPAWYQALSVQQMNALDSLATCIYQDLLKGLPTRTAVVIHKLGLVPRRSSSELMSCITLGSDDPKEMLAQLYFSMYGYAINGKLVSYCLNARLILSAILYLGLDNLILALEKTFAPDRSIAKSEPKPKARPPPKLPSPYLTELVAALYIPNRHRRAPPAPLPDLTVLNEPYVEEPVLRSPPPPPPPPPPPKKRIPISHCEQLAGIQRIEPHASPIELPPIHRASSRRTNRAPQIVESKKKYRTDTGLKPTKGTSKRRIRPPTIPGLWNAQYTINGIFEIQGKTCYVLGNVSILPALGELIHGGYALSNGKMINIHCGFRGHAPKQQPDPCDCLKQWQDSTFQYVKNNKCYCGHHYDLRNEGTFSQEELPFFTKPTRHIPLQFHYDNIFDTDEKSLYVKKSFKKIWETESMLRTAEDTLRMEKKLKKKKELKKAPPAPATSATPAPSHTDTAKAKDHASKVTSSKVNPLFAETSQTCLGTQPKITDYLKCGLRLMRKVNVAARLPDLYLVPELVEWMRQRLYGRLTVCQKKEYLRKSTTYWSMFKTLAEHGFGHVNPPNEPKYGRHTTWKYKQSLNDDFRQYRQRYKLSLFKSYAYLTNLFWRTMYQAEFPDKKFREIFFSYLFSTADDIQLIHPYSTRETTERKTILMNHRYICPPAGCDA